MKYEVFKNTPEQVLVSIRIAFIKKDAFKAQRLVEAYFSDLYTQDEVDSALLYAEKTKKESE